MIDQKACIVPPNGEAQPPGERDGVLKWYGARHEPASQNGPDSPVGWSAMLGRFGHHLNGNGATRQRTGYSVLVLSQRSIVSLWLEWC